MNFSSLSFEKGAAALGEKAAAVEAAGSDHSFHALPVLLAHSRDESIIAEKGGECAHAPGQIRTDICIFAGVQLYPLSYGGMCRNHITAELLERANR